MFCLCNIYHMFLLRLILLAIRFTNPYLISFHFIHSSHFISMCIALLFNFNSFAPFDIIVAVWLIYHYPISFYYILGRALFHAWPH